MGGKSLQWQVLERRGNQALLLAKEAVAIRPYHKEQSRITWEKCTLRSWLNGEFLNTAFRDSERKSIVLSHVPAEKNPTYKTNPGNPTQDSLFLLSIGEVQKYLPVEEARVFPGPDNAQWWWLRSPGDYLLFAAGVQASGEIILSGANVNSKNKAVRPALWLNLDPDEQ